MNRSDIRLPEETKDKARRQRNKSVQEGKMTAPKRRKDKGTPPTEQIRSRRKSDCTEETKDKGMPTPSRKAVAEWKRRRDER
ncbi:hypothetical protein JCM10003_3743 [Bacteroides pyogenes JCM 10003]|nr:hypothetical protein JCM10003_3743 [Bacteroides pyogenes JCM 10003]